MTAAAFVTSGTNYPVLDGILGISLIVHSHLGVRHASIIYQCVLGDAASSCHLSFKLMYSRTNFTPVVRLRSC